MKLISFQKLGENRNTPRVWLESRRLSSLGFDAGTPIEVETRLNSVELRPAIIAENHVSKRVHGGKVRPIIDIANRRNLSPLIGFREVKVAASYNQIRITPSIRAFRIQHRLEAQAPFRTIEVFAGGGTLSAAVVTNGDYRLVAGVEVEPKYADVWQQSHPSALLYQADVRRIHPKDLVPHDILIASIPCTSHSPLGRAKKSLAGKPELGDTGDLYLSVAEFVGFWLPAACVIENVPSFASSLAGQSLLHHFRNIGYSVYETILNPHAEWNEPQDRRRWIMIATLKEGFALRSPQKCFSGTAGDFLDAPSSADQIEVERIARSIEGLRKHNQRHAEMGHGFGFTTISRASKKIPTLVRSYHKINTGPFVETEYGLRLLRKHEAEKIMGCAVATNHYATAIEILGQGVQTRVFSEILRQLAQFLTTS